MSSKRQLNITFSIARVFAVLSIVAAHVSINGPEFITNMIRAVSSIGVTVFIILSGYFYRTQKYNSVFELLKDKFKTIIIPWLVMGTFTYVYYAVVSGGFSVSKWILWLLGYKTFLYYLPMLMLCYIIFYKRNKITLYGAILITVISVYCTAFGFLDGTIDALHITNYLNVFNWVGYFAIGCLLQQLDPAEIYDFFKNNRVIILVTFLVCYVLVCVFGINTGYFSFAGMPFNVLGASTVAGISTVSWLDKKLLHNISNMTFGVYLIHMPIIGILDTVYNINVITQLLAPLIVTATSLVILYIGYLVAKVIHIDNLYSAVTGIRLSRNIKEK